MKKIYGIILIFGALHCNSLFCQSSVYHPFPEDYGRWEMYETYYQPHHIGGVSGYVHSKYEVDSDTTINSINYKKVISSKSTKGTGLNDIYTPFGPKSYSFSYRNDIPNKKVYIFKNIYGRETDTLWYDFNLAVGDTIDNLGAYSFDGQGLSAKVKFIDSVNICNEYHKVFHFYAGDPNLSEAFCYLIEGVGFSRNFIQSEGRQFSPFENTEDFYTTFYCTPISIDEINNSSSQIEVFPNPVENTLQIKLTEKNTFLLQEYSVVDCLGRVVFSGRILDNNIDISMLEKGLYLLRIEDKERNIFQSKFVKQ